MNKHVSNELLSQLITFMWRFKNLHLHVHLKKNGSMFSWQVSLCQLSTTPWNHVGERIYSSTHLNLGTTWKYNQLQDLAILTGKTIASGTPEPVWTFRKWEKISYKLLGKQTLIPRSSGPYQRDYSD